MDGLLYCFELFDLFWSCCSFIKYVYEIIGVIYDAQGIRLIFQFLNVSRQTQWARHPQTKVPSDMFRILFEV